MNALAIRCLVLLISVVFVSARPAQKPLLDPCRVFGIVFIETDRAFADVRVFVEENEHMARVNVFREDNALYADRPGVWYITDDRNAADFRIYVEKNRSFAQFSVFYIDNPSFAGCR